MIKIIPESELILNSDGSVYHLNLLPHEIGDTILLVGDPDRVPEVSKHFDKIEIKKQKREFITHTGNIGSNKITVISSGIGTDNIDIVLNELDALCNIDLQTREVKTQKKSLNIVRIGTSGALQPDIEVDSMVVSTHGLGLDGLLWYYMLEPDFYIDLSLDLPHVKPYLVKSADILLKKFDNQSVKGITATCSGFYGPQGRQLRAETKTKNLVNILNQLQIIGNRITNFEMETSAILALSKLFGFNAISINAIIANRINNKFSKNGHQVIEKTIIYTLQSIFG
ncbi:MAG: nucleoside phosphorylase [Bacteroidia bacterium]